MKKSASSSSLHGASHSLKATNLTLTLAGLYTSFYISYYILKLFRISAAYLKSVTPAIIYALSATAVFFFSFSPNKAALASAFFCFCSWEWSCMALEMAIWTVGPDRMSFSLKMLLGWDLKS